MKQMLKLLILGLLSFIGCAEPETPIDNDQTSYADAFTIPLGGNTYQLAGEENTEITQDGIKSWSSPATVFGVFFKSSGAPKVKLNIDIEAQEDDSEIEFKINETSKKITLQKGITGIVQVGEFKLEAGYTKIEIQGISKGGSNFSKIKTIKIEHNNELSPSYVKDNQDNNFYWGRRGPSVHLGYQVPDDSDYKWFYNEMTIPEGQDPIGSYFMANGFAEGYFGIQVNSTNERRVLFSVWSPFVTDNPNDIPDDEKIVVLKKGENVYTGEFGNEGSGGQSYLVYNWKAGTTYRFLNAVEPDGNGNTIYTGYFFAPEIGEWQIIAQFKRPKTDTWYKRPHSFLENFNTRTGHIGRHVFYDNQWVRSTNGTWTELTTARFTGDAIANAGFRMDYAGGSRDGKFYLQNCGFFTPHTELNSMHHRSPNNMTPVIDFEHLETLGIALTAPEQIQEMDKSDWEIIAFSSEETSGEGATGRAKDVIDGDVNTYWHSQWTGTSASYPHYFVIDTKANTEITSFILFQRNGMRKIKDYKIYTSVDNQNWSLVSSGILLNNASQQNIKLSNKIEARYIKFEGLNSHDSDQFAALAEFGAF